MPETAARASGAAEPGSFALDLAQLRERRNLAALAFQMDAPALLDYVHSSGDRVVVARAARDDDSEALIQPTDPTDQSTCSSFAAAHYADPFSRRNGLGQSFPTLIMPTSQFDGSAAQKVLTTVLEDFKLQYGSLIENSAALHQSATENKDVAPLPNAYNTPIHLSGFVAAARHLRLAGDAEEVEATSSVAQTLVGWLSHGSGMISHINPSKRHPIPTVRSANSYLTYWCLRGLADWIELMRSAGYSTAEGALHAELVAVEDALQMALEAAKNRLGRIVSTQSSSLHDAVSLASALASVGLLSRRLRQQDEETAFLINQGAELLLTRYVLEDGSFAPKAVALTTRSGYSLVLSSPELAAMLIHGLSVDIPDEALARLDPVVDAVIRNSHGIRGWGVSARGSTDRKPAFVAFTACSFLRMYREVLDKRISALCAAELGVQPVPRGRRVEEFILPVAVRSELTDRVLRPLKDGRQRHLAPRSLILSGPPGNAKYEIARKLANELMWPFLVLKPSSFVHRGAPGAAWEASHVFDLLSELHDTVVFLDESSLDRTRVGEDLERSILAAATRGSGGKGGLERILLVVAVTGSPRASLVASSVGRHSPVFEVKAPTREERGSILTRELMATNASEALVQGFFDAGVGGLTEGLTVEYLRELVRNCVVLESARGALSHEQIEREVEGVKLRWASLRAEDEGQRG